MRKNTKVVVTQLRLTHYRVALFEALCVELKMRGIQLVLIYGQPEPSAINKQDGGELGWAIRVVNRYRQIGKVCLAWQPIPGEAKNVDLIVITQENRIISNYMHIFRRYFGGPKIAFWGHGANLQSKNKGGIRERFKRWSTNRVDYWFAYTKMSANLVSFSGFPSDRITILNNSVDTRELRLQIDSITLDDKRELRLSLGFGDGPVGIFVGSLYADKRLSFLFAAAEAIRVVVPEFHLLIVGDGAERAKVQEWCDAHPWACWVGTRFGKEKTAYLSVAQVMLIPGAVGLGILDAFACGVPLLTTDCGNHGPEIAYLENGRNGVMTADVLDDYVDAAVGLLRDPDLLSFLRAGCTASLAEYTVENMARRFADGIESALGVSANLKRCTTES